MEDKGLKCTVGLYTLGQLDEMHFSSFKIHRNGFNCALFWFGHSDSSHCKKCNVRKILQNDFFFQHKTELETHINRSNGHKVCGMIWTYI